MEAEQQVLSNWTGNCGQHPTTGCHIPPGPKVPLLSSSASSSSCVPKRHLTSQPRLKCGLQATRQLSSVSLGRTGRQEPCWEAFLFIFVLLCDFFLLHELVL